MWMSTVMANLNLSENWFTFHNWMYFFMYTFFCFCLQDFVHNQMSAVLPLNNLQRTSPMVQCKGLLTPPRSTEKEFLWSLSETIIAESWMSCYKRDVDTPEPPSLRLLIKNFLTLRLCQGLCPISFFNATFKVACYSFQHVQTTSFWVQIIYLPLGVCFLLNWQCVSMCSNAIWDDIILKCWRYKKKFNYNKIIKK